ncbi:UDP-N-acetylglucosamine 2-epimerase [Halodesulfovibrio marinisediminis]|uniref:UDP-N-acetylglucosamine 2-epimerase (Non-hydrolysing) n=1 Tax=Halodesulfovibrio marinisediminis DSM 17456 TaxID=1121457 RepID=A0A1N6FTI4_9BACT|nr:UDP-N-acetylglucosamine 2-epimerase [Halodesulfovibrio marinisediminis]SIN98532.1 UDP-N-acetylglucosamine 2-epimerase (non-hydrolysing) [Halodesulfovibrio marinisediminis DSM 17456]
MKKIAVFTGARSEYGLLYQLIKHLHVNEDVSLQLIVGGMHLTPEFGYTVTEIEKDGFPIAEKIDFLLSSGSAVGTAKSMGLALIAASDCLERLRPDLLVILGDRTESLAIAQAAMVTRIPIAHIHGGEITEGAIDEAIRHSLTKMSHLHFTSTEEYRKRVIQLGEQPDRVFNVGAPGIDNIVKLKLLSWDELQQSLPFSLSPKYIVMTYHPVTLLADDGVNDLKNLLDVIEEHSEYDVVITYPNADSSSHRVIELLKAFHEKNVTRVKVAQSLGQVRYLSVLKYCQAVVGNSSSGIIEAPSFGIPTINIGARQKGRVCSDSVLHSDGSPDSLRQCFSQITNPSFQKKCRTLENPYGQGTASERIAEVLLSTPFDKILSKTFYDI